jgi:hypothetical protein
VAYVLLFDPALAALVAWGVSMTTRQAGHFFFEPRGYDQVNQVTDEYKEAIKVGYNLRRKVVLLAAWVLAAAASVAGALAVRTDRAGHQGLADYVHDVGIAWLALGVAGLLLRVAQLCLRCMGGC